MGVFLAFLSGVFTIIGNVYAEEWARSDGPSRFALMLLWYTLGAIAFPFSLKFGGLTIMSTIGSVVTAAVTALIGLAVYHERVTYVQAVALLLAFAAIVMLSWPVRQA